MTDGSTPTKSAVGESLSGYLSAKGKGVLVFFPRRVLFGAALSQVQEAFGFVFQRVDEPRFSEGDLCECIDESRPVSRFRRNNPRQHRRFDHTDDSACPECLK